MKNAEYYITSEQLEDILHYKNMFELEAERINTLCKCERDDIEMGFELGKIHSQLRELFLSMIEFETTIQSQLIENKET